MTVLQIVSRRRFKQEIIRSRWVAAITELSDDLFITIIQRIGLMSEAIGIELHVARKTRYPGERSALKVSCSYPSMLIFD